MNTLANRSVERLVRGMPTSDGAGVKLTRVIGQPQLADLDPFLMLDEFGTDNPGDYIAGFPDHPHRGFETVTYMLDGCMRHRDNHGHEGVLVPGSVQWMTAGRGIIHSEMPEQQQGRMRGFQLWINLPAREKMTEPRYQEFGPQGIPTVETAAARVKVIAGTVEGVAGPIAQPATDPTYLDIELAPGGQFTHALPAGHTAFVYVYEGTVALGAGEAATEVDTHDLAVLGDTGAVRIEARVSSGSPPSPARLILVAGKPLREPVAKYGPFVMNTREELMQAFQDFQSGRF
ncbi:MAG: pirin family protein [Steroidobacteraceae bacterium]